jgi:hypothetical protein
MIPNTRCASSTLTCSVATSTAEYSTFTVVRASAIQSLTPIRLRYWPGLRMMAGEA